MNKPDMKEAKKRFKEETKIIRDAYKIPDTLKEFGKNKKYCILTYGCQMNVHDSELIAQILSDMGFCCCDNYEKSDIIIINTCAIRENAHNKIFGIMGRIKHLKKDNPNIILGIGGCMAQEEHVVDELLAKHKEVDFVFGTHNIHELASILEKTLESKKQEVEVYSNQGSIFEDMHYKRDNAYKAWVNIMLGCDKFCTYCIVPYVRGKQRSRLKEDIISEVEDLIKKGYKEVTLLGQNVNAYGKDIENVSYDFATLLESVAKTGIERIRFMTSHPWDFTDKMIEVISCYDNIMSQVHLPVQSGSDEILRRMGRRYTKDEYLTLFDKLKNKMPNISISTDIIVGFPGESKEDFEGTLDLVDQCKYDLAYTFIYSPRVGTVAAGFDDDTPMEVKEQRLQELNEKINYYAKASNDKMVGQTVKVLIEGESKKEGMMFGYTENGKLMNVETDKSNLGKIIEVEVCSAKTWSLDGKETIHSR